MDVFSKMMAAGVGIILFGVSVMFLLEGLNMKYLWFYEEYFDDLYLKNGACRLSSCFRYSESDAALLL